MKVASFKTHVSVSPSVSTEDVVLQSNSVRFSLYKRARWTDKWRKSAKYGWKRKRNETKNISNKINYIYWGVSCICSRWNGNNINDLILIIISYPTTIQEGDNCNHLSFLFLSTILSAILRIFQLLQFYYYYFQ